MLAAMLRACSAAMLVLALAAPAASGSDAEPAARPEKAPSRDGRRTLSRLPANLLRGTVGLFAAENLVPFTVGAGTTALAFVADDEVRSEMRGHDLGGLQSFGDKLGDVEVVVPLTAGLFLAGRAVHDTRFRNMTYDLAQAQITTTILGGSLKRIVGRERPNGTNAHSFPSGHSYSWFVMATVVERHYGMRVAGPVFALWALTGTSRLANDTHYVSDVVAGAALGLLVGRPTGGRHDEPLSSRRAAWHVVPAWGGRGQAALAVNVVF
jgi:membrane-associated phospholipid phosphatase